LPFSLVSVLGDCLCMLHLLGPFHDQALSLHESKGSMTCTEVPPLRYHGAAMPMALLSVA
ncbi:unnamed protein product, partial [Musa acuminata subsp. burmannicoides]